MEQEKDKFDLKDAAQEPSVEKQEVLEDDKSQGQTENGSEVDKLSADLAEAKDKYLRLYADFENFRRRGAKEKIEYLKTANEELIKEILPIVDDFQRALKSLENDSDSQAAKEGMQIIYNKLLKVLEQKGLKPMESVGTEFNPELHESIAQIPAPSSDMKGKVIDEVEKGYYLQDKVIRFAKVVVGA